MSSSFRKRRTRRGISLMEVLISMFVLTVGLLGVAALIPAGRHEIVEAAKLDNASMVGRAAFRDMQVRGFLNPEAWSLSPQAINSVFTPIASDGNYFTVRNSAGGVSLSNQVAYCLDPLGRTAAAGDYGPDFPNPAAGGSNPPALMRIVPFATASLAASRAVYDSIFRSSFDQILEPNATNTDFPPSPKWFSGNSRRMSEGNYSWLATIVSDSSKPAISSDVAVSVAVFYKRDLSQQGAGEYIASVDSFPLDPADDPTQRIIRMTSGGEIVLRDLPINPITNKRVILKPGQWIMLAGSGNALNYYRWYRVLSAAAPAPATPTIQRVTLTGQDWQVNASATRAWIFDNIVNVYEKQMPLEVP